MTFKNLLRNLENLNDGTETIIGQSVENRPIHAFHVGNKDDNQIIVTAAIHAREWITSLLATELIKLYREKNLDFGIWFVPLVNPDGVKIALEHEPLWKANARGVDLNVNFDAEWGTGAQNVRVAGSENYIGPYPNSEPEVQALIEFTREVNPIATIAFHSKGEVIYYGFRNHERDYKMVKKLSKVTGYEPIRTRNSAGGYSDWVSLHIGVPAFTIEVGDDALPHPVGIDQLGIILEQNKDIFTLIYDTI